MVFLMQTIPSKEAKDQFGTFLNTVQREPVAITSHGRRVAVTLSARDFETLGGQDALRKLQQERFRVNARDKGFSEEDIDQMLSEPTEQDKKELRAVMNSMQKTATKAGLTQEKLDTILEEIYQDMYGE
jgi:prevent-host-death family protein